MKLTRQSRDAWYKFLNNVDNVGHAQREILKNDIDQHVNLCMESAINMTKGLQADLPDNFNPKSILEIGSSAGLNCYALKIPSKLFLYRHLLPSLILPCKQFWFFCFQIELLQTSHFEKEADHF